MTDEDLQILDIQSDLSKEALRRKQRLAEMKAKHSHSKKCSEVAETSANDSALPKPVFRSYKPSDETLKAGILEKADLLRPEKQVQDQLDAAKVGAVEVDVATLAPRKPDWDLKRDIAPLLDKLERRTQRAIAEIIKERLQANKDSDADWAEAVSARVDAERQFSQNF